MLDARFSTLDARYDMRDTRYENLLFLTKFDEEESTFASRDTLHGVERPNVFALGWDNGYNVK